MFATSVALLLITQNILFDATSAVEVQRKLWNLKIKTSSGIKLRLKLQFF